jgi:hypothetical protein
MEPEHKTEWFGIGKQILSFVAGVIVAAFVVGGARQKVHDLVIWKEEIAPRIERMDSKGTVSFEIFEKNYDKQQERQNERLKELEREVKDLQRKVDP